MLIEFNKLVTRSNGTLNGKRTSEEWFKNSNNHDILNWFNDQTKDLINYYGFRERIVLLNANHRTPPLCLQCNSPVRVDQQIIHQFCSTKCSTNSLKVRSKTKDSHLKRFGTDHPMRNTDIKNKLKTKMIEKYGVEYALQDLGVREKIKNTNKAKYGFLNPMQNLNVRSQAKNTFDLRYRNNPEKMKELYDKRVNTNLQKFNRISNTQIHLSDETLKKLEDKNWLLLQYETKSSVEIAEDLDCYYGTVINYLRKYGAEIKKSRNFSRFENWVLEFLKDKNIINIEIRNRSILQGKEIDILLPDYKLGIEIDGVYWHSNVHKNYHQNKTILARENGISLIHITDNDLLNRKNLIFNILLGKLNKLDTIYARNTTIREITAKEANDFLHEHHLQGESRAKIKLGLFHKNTLVQLATFDTPRFNKNYKWELIRNATIQGSVVVGGFSKIIKYFRNKYLGSIISYVDLQYFNGNSYESTGWTKVGITSPGYVWVKDEIIVSRYRAQKNKLSKILPDYDYTKTEKENMEDAGFIRYWNCGNMIYHLL